MLSDISAMNELKFIFKSWANLRKAITQIVFSCKVGTSFTTIITLF